MPKDGKEKGSYSLSFIRVPTRQLKLIVAQHKKVSSEDRFNQFIEMIRKVFDQYYSCLAEFEPGMDRAMMAHKITNRAIEQSGDLKPSCARGCSACCHFEVEVTSDEGALLAGLVKEGLEVDRKRLAIQSSRKRQGLEWSNVLDPSNRCVFLGPDQHCRVYDFRPLICRKHIVSTPPSQCENGTEEPILIPLAEIAVSAALSQPGNVHSSLSKMLNPILAKEEKKRPGKTEELPAEV